MVARSVSTARSTSLLNSRSDCPAPSAGQSQRRRHKCQHPDRGRQPDVADLLWQGLRGETANSPLDRMTAYQAVLDSRDPGQGLLWGQLRPRRLTAVTAVRRRDPAINPVPD